jgi:hypothetical protein
MPGRRLCSEKEAIARGFRGPECARRRQVLKETLAAFAGCQPPDRYHRLAADNLRRWYASRVPSPDELNIQVIAGDWGDVTHKLTREHGVCFAVLNMANAFVPGGAYVEGAPAQEENMFRRTDCHFRVDADEYIESDDAYRPHMIDLLSAENGRVYLNVERPRVCVRGPEDRQRDDLGYAWLPDDEIFPFFELRASAQDLRGALRFDVKDARRRIAAQLDTMIEKSVRHAILSAFGCGAFRNPADVVARLYREEIAARKAHFDVIAFAIFAPGYGPDNYEPFAREFAKRGR